MTKRLALLCGCLALAMVGVGCGDDDEDEGGDGGGGGAAQTETQEEKPAGGGAKTVNVSMRDTQFQPADVTIPRGGRVKWTNEDSVGHDVTKESGAGPDFKSGDPGGMGEGDSYFRNFNAAGKIEYICTVHAPGMKGTITVR